MASLDWYVRTGATSTLVPSTSGIGFFGAGGFGYSIKTGEFNDTCYITNASGTIEGPQALNNKYITASSVLIWASSTYHNVQAVPNEKAVVNLKFTHTSPVDVQNAWVTACERLNPTVNPSVNVFVAELAHTSTIFDTSTYSDSTWTQVYGNSATLSISNSPGESGQYSGAGTTGSDDAHDWYLMVSVQPTSGGNKYFALYAELEYL